MHDSNAKVEYIKLKVMVVFYLTGSGGSFILFNCIFQNYSLLENLRHHKVSLVLNKNENVNLGLYLIAPDLFFERFRDILTKYRATN